jgi:hypothetical protein
MDILFTTIRDILESLFPSVLSSQYAGLLDLISMTLVLAGLKVIFVDPLARLFGKKKGI